MISIIFLLFLCCTCYMISKYTDSNICVMSRFDCFSASSLFLPGGRRAAEEKGDLSGRLSLFFHVDLGHEGRRPKHPRPGVLRAPLCHRSHHWQAGPVETQTDRAQWRTDGVLGRTRVNDGNEDVFWVYVDFSFFFLLFFNIEGNIVMVCLDGK